MCCSRGKAFSGGSNLSSKGAGLSSAGVGKSLEGFIGRIVEPSNEFAKSGRELFASVVNDFLSSSGSVGKGGKCLLGLGLELCAEVFSIVVVLQSVDPLELLLVPFSSLLD